MKMTVEAKLIYKDTDCAKIGVSIDHNSVHKMLIPEFYLAILKAMRDAHTNAFYNAMIPFIEGELDNEND